MSYLSILLATNGHPWVIGLATHTTYRVGLSGLSKMHSQKQYGDDGTLKTFHTIWHDSMMYNAYMKKKCLTDLQHLAAIPSGLFNRFREFVDFNHQGSSRGCRTSTGPTVAGSKCMAWSWHWGSTEGSVDRRRCCDFALSTCKGMSGFTVKALRSSIPKNSFSPLFQGRFLQNKPLHTDQNRLFYKLSLLWQVPSEWSPSLSVSDQAWALPVHTQYIAIWI